MESGLASSLFFPYSFRVNERYQQVCSFAVKRFLQSLLVFGFVAALACRCSRLWAGPQQATTNAPPVVTKIEPPSWWTGLTTEVMLLLSGRDLEATHLSCNLQTLTVSRTQSTAG